MSTLVVKRLCIALRIRNMNINYSAGIFVRPFLIEIQAVSMRRFYDSCLFASFVRSRPNCVRKRNLHKGPQRALLLLKSLRILQQQFGVLKFFAFPYLHAFDLCALGIFCPTAAALRFGPALHTRRIMTVPTLTSLVDFWQQISHLQHNSVYK